MTTNPTTWKPKFTANAADLAGMQRQGESVGLANGNILVLWASSLAGNSTGDLVGQIFDPTGVAIGSPITLADDGNLANAKVAAMSDGGFVVAYRSYGTGANSAGVIVDRFNAGGGFVTEKFIDSFNFTVGARFDITVTAAGNYVVAYEQQAGDDLDVHAAVFRGSDNALIQTITTAAQNGEDDDRLGGVAVFATGTNVSAGDIVVISNEKDDNGVFSDPYETTEIRITSASGALVRESVHIAGSDGHGAVADDVIVLPGDKYVALYHYADGAPGIAFRIGAVQAFTQQTPFGLTLTSEIAVTSSTGARDSSLVALPGGGFFVAYLVGNSLFGNRYNASGGLIGTSGEPLAIAGTVSSDNDALGQLSLTSDGRILVPFRDSAGEISEVILDPRDGPFNGTDADDVLTGQTTGSFIFGNGGNDHLFGHDGDDNILGGLDDDTIRGGGGADIIYGEAGLDVLFGGAGDDTLEGGAQGDQLNGEAGDDTLEGGADADVLRGGLNNDTYVLNTLHTGTITRAYDTVIENAGEGTDTVLVTPFTGFQSPTSYTLPANVERGTILGTAAFNLTGNADSNVLTGNSGVNRLTGLGGDDSLDGGGGIDTAVFTGNRAAYSLVRAAGATTVTGPDGIDTLTSVEKLQFADATVSLLPRNDFNGDGKSDVLFSIPGTNFDSDYMWQMNDRSITSQGAIDLYDKAFSVQVVGDYDGDGKADVVFQNPTTGGVWQWLLDGTAIKSQGAVDVGDSSFHLLGSADFSGDGKDDLLFRNDAGFVYMWQMNGRVDTPLAVGPLDPSWHVAGAGDFDGDGRADLLLHNISATPDNGAYFLWRMNGNQIIGQGGIERPPASWHTLAVGDFDGDGKSDFAIRNQSATSENGAVWVYLMDGTTIKSQGAAGIVKASEFNTVGVGDYNGDGKDDILFRNAAGYFYSWDMNGKVILSEGAFGTEAGNFADPAIAVVTQHWDLV